MTDTKPYTDEAMAEKDAEIAAFFASINALLCESIERADQAANAKPSNQKAPIMTDYTQKARDKMTAGAHMLDVLHCAALTEALDTERAAHEATKEAIKRQAAAVRTLQASEATEINILRKERHKAQEAIKTLESERAANALLTDELEATKAELQALRDAADRCILIVERYNHRQNEKVDDVKLILRQALTRKDT
jgi:chromosome segregation ATPase